MRKHIINLAWKIKGIDVSSRYNILIRRELWSKDQWLNNQNEQFLSLVRHCYENIPFYTDSFNTIGLKPSDIHSIEDIEKIPILTKEMVRNNLHKLVDINLLDKSLVSHTTGSTGKPLSYYGSKERSLAILAGLWRLYDRCGWQPGEQVASIWGFKNHDQSGWKMKLRDYFSGITHLNAWKANDPDFEKWFESIKSKKVSIIMCYGSSGSRFANWMIANNKSYDGIKGVFSTSEKLYEHQKVQIEQAFNCPVYDMYGCGEVIHLACSCKNGKMHLNPDMSIVEEGTLNGDGQTPLIVTGLTNHTMPFLRYQNGDAGSLTDEKCTCGLNTPLMELKVSRLSDVFTFSDGKKYPSLYFVLRLYKEGFDGVELFQFHQDKIDHIFLRIVKNDRFSDCTHDNILQVIDEIKEHINQKAKVSLIYQEYIEQSSTSKHYYAKSDIS
jgi:phenylacetate-CoA ligase